MYGTLLQVGPIVLKSYTTALALAFLLGTLLAARRARHRGISPHEVVRIATLAIIASIVGARLLYVLEHARAFVEAPRSILFLWRGGLSYHGGLFLGISFSFLWLKSKKIPIGKVADIFAPSMALGLGIVRIGCFLNGCCFGTPTQMPWGLVFPPDCPAGWVYGNIMIHPTQLYAAISALISFAVLLRVEKRNPFREGKGLIFLLFLVLSSSWRFILEWFRYQDAYGVIGGRLTMVQVYCLGIFMLSCAIIFLKYGKHKLVARRQIIGAPDLDPNL